MTLVLVIVLIALAFGFVFAKLDGVIKVCKKLQNDVEVLKVEIEKQKQK